jgi:carbon-monoxide dehydrogenase large subunit
MARINLTVDGVPHVDDVEARLLLVSYLRERLGKTGTVIGCDTTTCGACMVEMDGASVKSCAVLAVQADARTVTTVAGPGNGSTRADDIALPGMLHLAVLRSPAAHAKITWIDVLAAQEHPGVVAVLTGRDLTREDGVAAAQPDAATADTAPRPLLAVDEVRHIGQGVAVVVARDRATAVDALEAIEVDYAPLPEIPDVEVAISRNAALVHAGRGTNTHARWVFDAGETGAGNHTGPTFATADIVVTRRFHQQHVGSPAAEPLSVVAAPTGDGWTLWSASRVPHLLRARIAQTTNTPEHQVHIVTTGGAGAGGATLEVMPEELIAFLVAKRLGVPVKFTDQTGSVPAAPEGHDQLQDISLAARWDGTVLGITATVTVDLGAYPGQLPARSRLLGVLMFPGVYAVGAYRYECTGVYTTRSWTDGWRGPGAGVESLAGERLMDELAAELGIDPMELRRRNWVRCEGPRAVAGLSFRAGDYEAATTRAMALFDYDALRSEQAERRERGDRVQLGIGISILAEASDLELHRGLGSLPRGVRLCAVEVDTETGQAHRRRAVRVAADGRAITASDAGRPEESGPIVDSPVEVNAIVDAVRHLGVLDVPVPCTPEHIWRSIRDSRRVGAPGGAR